MGGFLPILVSFVDACLQRCGAFLFRAGEAAVVAVARLCCQVQNRENPVGQVAFVYLVFQGGVFFFSRVAKRDWVVFLLDSDYAEKVK